jgi:organic radical activating enzyme
MKFCKRPWEFLEIYGGKNELTIYNCCPGWVDDSIGSLPYEDSLDTVWNGEKSKEFRKSILDGSFSHCKKCNCSFIQNGSLPEVEDVLNGKHGSHFQKIVKEKVLESEQPYFVNLCYDMSCNLKCPSCRLKIFMIDSNSIEYESKKRFQEKLIDYLGKLKKDVIVNVTGTGDPFASRLFWEFLQKIDGKLNPHIGINLQTNGQLFNEQNWQKLNKLHGNPISACISLDAGTEVGYGLTRVGGSWKKLMQNLEFISILKREKKIAKVRLDFVVQKNNYNEMQDFVEISKKFGFDCYFSKIMDWNTYSPDEFNKHNILDKNHAEHKNFLKIIGGDFKYEKIDFGNLSKFRKKLFA